MYQKLDVNYPRLKTDIFFSDRKTVNRFNGYIDEIIRFVEEFQLLDEEMWARFADQFKTDSDSDGNWRGEYWGKMLRGACFVYQYTKNEKLYNSLEKTIYYIMNYQDDLGRISTYSADKEFFGWDMWCRKYVILSMEYFIEICKDDALTEKIKNCIKGQLDYIISKIGSKEDGKTPITETSEFFGALNSSSILEPVVRFYNLTQDKKYLDFATHIVDCGGSRYGNIFELIHDENIYPYQLPVTKAYEMISCFEGLLEYYRVTGIEKHKEAVIKFADKLLKTEFTVTGSSCCFHEFFDYSTARQANSTNGETAQETCVTVTLMKFLFQVTLLTGNAKYADAFERSLYNAYFGAVNTEKAIGEFAYNAEVLKNCQKVPLPFDSYSPLVSEKRGNGIGGLLVMSDNTYYGCCACIGSAGCGLINQMALLKTKDGFVLNLFTDGETRAYLDNGNEVNFKISTEYPKYGKVKITVETKNEESFGLFIRNPEWSKNTTLSLNGKQIKVNDGYIKLEKITNGDEIELNLDMRTRVIRPLIYDKIQIRTKWMGRLFPMEFEDSLQDEDAKGRVALMRGPIVLAQDERVCNLNTNADIEISDGFADVNISEISKTSFANIVEAEVGLKDGGNITLTDYASAGKDWKSKVSVWIKCK